MKKFIAIALALVMTLSLAACGFAGILSAVGDSDDASSPESDTKFAPRPAPTPAPDGDGGNGTSADNGANAEPNYAPLEIRPSVELGVGDNIEFGGHEWRVLDMQEGRVLVISETILELRDYHGKQESITWEHSDMRSYLNGEFLGQFSAAEQAIIAETWIETPDNPWFINDPYHDENPASRPRPYGGNATLDRIFLLSTEEVVKYFGDSGQLSDRPHDERMNDGLAVHINDQYNEDRIAYTELGEAKAWVSRSTGKYAHLVALVDAAGYMFIGGYFVLCPTSEPYYGVRPAMWIDYRWQVPQIDWQDPQIGQLEPWIDWQASPYYDYYRGVLILLPDIPRVTWPREAVDGWPRPGSGRRQSPAVPPQSVVNEPIAAQTVETEERERDGNIGAVPFAPITLVLDRFIYAPGGNIAVTIDGLPAYMEESGAFIAIYEQGADHDAYLEYQYPKSRRDNLVFTAPTQPGEYEIRLYRMDHVYSDETLVLSVPFIVVEE